MSPRRVAIVTAFVALWALFDTPALTLSGFRGATLATASDKAEKAEPTKKKKKKKKVVKEKEGEETQEEAKPAAIGEHSSYGNAQFDRELAKPNTVDAVLLLDSSGSMQRTDPGRLRIQAAKLFLRFLGEGDRVAVFQFDQDVKPLLPLTSVSPETIDQIDKTLDSIPAEGGFTDLEAPVAQALNLLRAEGGVHAIKSVVLLSDGQMDPHPEKGVPQALIDKLNESVLPEYRITGTRLYTVAMSPEADRELLQKMAEQTDGLNWFAPTVESLHMKFSDLFLALKKPQVAPLEGGGFEIDPAVREATFYINRTGAEAQITLITPKGDSFSTIDFPSNVKWYRGEMFDVVTISSPLPGRWGVRGVENPEGFATLVTDLQAQVRWPQNNLKVGDSVAFFARLIADGKPFNEPGIGDITFFQYKIVSTRKNEIVASGAMNDAGKDGDEKAGDGIYSAKITVGEDGEHRAFVGVTSPTFTRQQQVPFKVSEGLVDMTLEPGDEFTGTHSLLKIVLGDSAQELEGLDVRVLVEREGEEKLTSFKAEKTKNAAVYQLSTEKLPVGKLLLSARVSGKEPKTKKSISGLSHKLEFVSEKAKGSEAADGDAAGAGEEFALEAENEEPVDRSWIAGLVAFLIAVAWSGGLIFYVKKKLDFGKGLPEREKRYERPAALAAEIKAIEAKVSTRKRVPNPEDFVVFELARATLDNAAKRAAAQNQEEAAPSGEAT